MADGHERLVETRTLSVAAREIMVDTNEWVGQLKVSERVVLCLQILPACRAWNIDILCDGAGIDIEHVGRWIFCDRVQWAYIMTGAPSSTIEPYGLCKTRNADCGRHGCVGFTAQNWLGQKADVIWTPEAGGSLDAYTDI